MSKRLMWVDDNAIHNGPDIEGYWLIDGGGYEATELQAIADAWRKWLNAVETATDSTEILNAWESFEKEVDALVERGTP